MKDFFYPIKCVFNDIYHNIGDYFGIIVFFVVLIASVVSLIIFECNTCHHKNSTFYDIIDNHTIVKYCPDCDAYYKEKISIDTYYKEYYNK